MQFQRTYSGWTVGASPPPALARLPVLAPPPGGPGQRVTAQRWLGVLHLAHRDKRQAVQAAQRSVRLPSPRPPEGGSQFS